MCPRSGRSWPYSRFRGGVVLNRLQVDLPEAALHVDFKGDLRVAVCVVDEGFAPLLETLGVDPAEAGSGVDPHAYLAGKQHRDLAGAAPYHRAEIALPVLGGAVYVVAGVVQLASPEQTDPFSRTSDYLIGVLLALSFLLTLAGFLALHLLQAGRYGGPRGWTGFRAAVLGQGAMLVSAVTSLAAGGLALGFLYVIGVFVLLVGLALLSVAT